MSGHSKWSTIKRQKEIKDSRRGQIFTKLANAITIAVKNGGGITDPEKNFKLRLSIEKARSLNMPKENIQRAINRGSGDKEASSWSEVVYEGYGPEGIAVVVEAATDNRNRTGAEIKNIFERAGGSLSGPGSVSFQFNKTGFLTVVKKDNVDEQVLSLIDLGAQDVEEVIDMIEVYTKPEELKEIKDQIEEKDFEVLDVELIMKPINSIPINTQEKAGKILKFMESLEEHDDVQKVYSNFDIPDKLLNS